MSFQPHKKRKFFPVHASKAHNECRGIAPLIFYLGTRWRLVVSFTSSPYYPWNLIQVPIEYVTERGSYGHFEIQISDSSARSLVLYRLRYFGSSASYLFF